MASVYRRKRRRAVPANAEMATNSKGNPVARWTDRKTKRQRSAPVVDGKIVVESGAYLVAYVDHVGRRQQHNTGTTDKATAQRIAAKIESDVALRRDGVIDADAEEFAKQVKRPIAEHVADYEASLSTRSAKHAGETIGKINRVIGAGKIADWGMMTPTIVERALSVIMATTKGKASPETLANREGGDAFDDVGMSSRTRNKYLTAIKAFANWMVKQKRAKSNPIKGVERLPEGSDEYRRPFELNEFRRFIAAAETGEQMVGRTRGGNVRWSMTGPERALMYTFTVETGLRRGAIDRLTVSDFDLGTDPSVTVRPKANTKNRKLQRIPLRVETARRLADHFAEKLPTASAFDMPADWETADVLRADLAVARQAWIAEGVTPEERAERANSPFLADVDADGRRLDFHALRTTCATWLDLAGVAGSVATRITGHTNVQTLQKHYHRSTDGQARQAIESLPSVTYQATGTCDVDMMPTDANGSTNGQQMGSAHAATMCDSVRSGAIADNRHVSIDDLGRHPEATVNAELSDALRISAENCENTHGRIRTCDLRIRSPLLYPTELRGLIWYIDLTE